MCWLLVLVSQSRLQHDAMTAAPLQCGQAEARVQELRQARGEDVRSGHAPKEGMATAPGAVVSCRVEVDDGDMAFGEWHHVIYAQDLYASLWGHCQKPTIMSQIRVVEITINGLTKRQVTLVLVSAKGQQNKQLGEKPA